MDPEAVAFTMLRDTHRDELVIGKTKEQLTARFGRLQTLAEVSDYLRMGYVEYRKGSDVRFIANSPWMIVFDRDKATELDLMKGY